MNLQRQLRELEKRFEGLDQLDNNRWADLWGKFFDLCQVPENQHNRPALQKKQLSTTRL